MTKHSIDIKNYRGRARDKTAGLTLQFVKKDGGSGIDALVNYSLTEINQHLDEHGQEYERWYLFDADGGLRLFSADYYRSVWGQE